MTGIHGWLVVDKPVGPTSAQVVGKLKWALRQGGHGKIRIGHGGTLDPLASGVLPIALGEATKLAGYLLNGRKGYRFTLAFGAATSTDDAEGEVVETSPVRPAPDAIHAVLPQFLGPIQQQPPAYSALKVDGKRAYARARAGEAVSLPTREITIHSLLLVAADEQRATFDVACSKGTYVRSLARDLARMLGTVGHVSMLRRTGAGAFQLEAALPLDKCVELLQGPEPEQALLPLTAGLDDIPVLAVTPLEAEALRTGRRIERPQLDPGQFIATLGSVPVALVGVDADGLKVVRGFNLL